CITYSANPVNAQSITVSNALCLETCLLKHTSALNQIYQIGDCITYSANPVNAQSITVSNALCLETCFIS
ncbi:hypothetical protein JYG89_08320, partial [Latilactobacillus curvatus]|uniref:hypothetical protein n=1 Tax=Latilactobacillus curvatus TaxID=28038 RepID=UPI001CBCEF70